MCRVDIDFQAILDEDESFCGQTSGCAVSAYYVEVDVDDEEEDLDFATTCQAFGGTVAYEAIVTTDSTMAESAYTTSACVELPQRVRIYFCSKAEINSLSMRCPASKVDAHAPVVTSQTAILLANPALMTVAGGSNLQGVRGRVARY